MSCFIYSCFRLEEFTIRIIRAKHRTHDDVGVVSIVVAAGGLEGSRGLDRWWCWQPPPDNSRYLLHFVNTKSNPVKDAVVKIIYVHL